MTPVLAPPRSTHVDPHFKIRIAATIACKAAQALAGETPVARDSARYLSMADRLKVLLRRPAVDHRQFLQASPAVIEFSGRQRTLIEMIEADPGDDVSRLRLAKILLRALIWLPETFPFPND